MKVIKIHLAGSQPVKPVEGSRGYDRVKARGCRPSPSYDWGLDVGNDCGHDYAWSCDDCPALPDGPNCGLDDASVTVGWPPL